MKRLARDLTYHRTRNRIRVLGEVFTPEQYVENMLDLIATRKSKLWSDENVSFFEPCCGHGNIVLPIFKRRLSSFLKKAEPTLKEEAPFYAVANAINTLWAIDIDIKNVEDCQRRLLHASMDFILEHIHEENFKKVLRKKSDFFAHFLAAVRWHIVQNEAISALSTTEQSAAIASITKTGKLWLSKNGHNPLDFKFDWCTYFRECQFNDTIPLDYERALRFIKAAEKGIVRGFEDFSFAKDVIIERLTDQEMPLEIPGEI